jgi:hypothetical protein
MVWFFRQFIISYIATRFPSCDQPGVSRVYVARPLLRSSAGDLFTLAPRPSPAKSHQVYWPAAKLEVVSYSNRTRQDSIDCLLLTYGQQALRGNPSSHREFAALSLSLGGRCPLVVFLNTSGGCRALAVRVQSKSKLSPSYMCSGVPHHLVTLRERESID